MGGLRLGAGIFIFLHRPNLPFPRCTFVGATLFHTVENRRRFGAFTGDRLRMYFINLRGENG